MLGGDAASRLVTSPALADIAVRDESARAKSDEIRDFLTQAYQANPARDPSDPFQPPPAPTPAIAAPAPTPAGAVATTPLPINKLLNASTLNVGTSLRSATITPSITRAATSSTALTGIGNIGTMGG